MTKNFPNCHRTLSLLILGLHLWSVRSSQLRNVTRNVFGSEIQILPLAFGDFNSDKLTDLIVVDAKDRSKLAILLAEPQIFSLTARKYFDLTTEARKKGLVCYINGFDVISAAPGDFDGDGGMDVMVVTKKFDSGGQRDPYSVFVLWGSHNYRTDEHKLECPTSWEQGIEMNSEPLIIDGNGDNIADLYGSTNHTRGIWNFGQGRSKPPYYVILDDGKDGGGDDVAEVGQFRDPHSNAFVDLNTDGNADLFVTGVKGFELWQNVGDKADNHFEKHKSIAYPSCSSSTATTSEGGAANRCIGQSVFADFTLDGTVDMIFPVCVDAECGKSILYFATTKSLWSGEQKIFLPLPLILGDEWQFDLSLGSDDGDDDKNPYLGLSPHVGDINLDGYPDLLIRLRHKSTKQVQMHVLLNIEDSSSPTPHNRGFLLQAEIMKDINDTVIATFYDLYENGQEDIMLVQRNKEGELEIGIYTNMTQDSDAYFVKIIVLSGVCYKNCPGDHVNVPYGTNMPGQTICYRTQRPSAEETSVDIQSCASQLAQTAHHALQLPYTIFGLGLSPNFLDVMSVNVTNATHPSRGKSWTQIIPNSQMYVIPNPPDSPNLWEAKLFITPSRGITLTGLALVGTCGLCVLIILFFHWRERRQDRREKLQQPNQFHFDAM